MLRYTASSGYTQTDTAMESTRSQGVIRGDAGRFHCVGRLPGEMSITPLIFISQIGTNEAKNRLGEIFYAPVDVVLGEDDAREVVQPDLLFISYERCDIITEQEIRGAPDLAVEILSRGTEGRDRKYKKALYGRYGVKEYWIVDPEAETIEVYASTETGMQRTGVYGGSDAVVSPLWPKLKLVPEGVF